MLETIFKIKESVDVFVAETESPDKILLIFHKMTTRGKIEVVAGKPVAEFLALIDGIKSAKNIFDQIGNFNEKEALKLIEFLAKKRLIIDTKDNHIKDIRYARQITYFDDLIDARSGSKTQELLKSKHVTIFGCGAVGGGIAEILIRAGISKITLVDYKKTSEGNLQKDSYSRIIDIGTPKVNSLSRFLKSINHEIEISLFDEILLPQTDLSNLISKNTNLVINTCDEPYIGHTSLKIGRYLSGLGIPLYIAGGFDAHLMSSGELIYPPFTTCIDCAQKTFSIALGDWKPTYSLVEILEPMNSTEKYISGGPAGIVGMSSFSANLASLRILEFLAEDKNIDFSTVRYEYLINSGIMTTFEMKKQENCHACNFKV